MARDSRIYLVNISGYARRTRRPRQVRVSEIATAGEASFPSLPPDFEGIRHIITTTYSIDTTVYCGIILL